MLARYSLHIFYNNKNQTFIWYISFLAPVLICLQSPDILVAILHSWVYHWRNQGNKRLYLPLSGAEPPTKKKTPQHNTDTFNRQPTKGSWSCLLAGFSSYIRLLKKSYSSSLCIAHYYRRFLGGNRLPWAGEANGGKALRKGGMKLQVVKSHLAFDHLIMKSNYREASRGSLFFLLFIYQRSPVVLDV